MKTFLQCFTKEASEKLLANGYELFSTQNLGDETKVWVFLNNGKAKFEKDENDYRFTNRMNF